MVEDWAVFLVAASVLGGIGWAAYRLGTRLNRPTSGTREFCLQCGRSFLHRVETDDHGEHWKTCPNCGRRQYVGR